MGAFLFFSINSLSRFPPFLTRTKSSATSSVIISPNFLVVFNPLSLLGKFPRNSWFLPIFIPPLTKILQVSERRSVNVVMEAKRGTKKSSSGSSNSSRRQQYEAPLGYIIEDVRPNGGIEKFRSAAYSNCVRKPS